MNLQTEMRLFGFLWLILSDVSHEKWAVAVWTVLSVAAFVFSFIVSADRKERP